MTSHIKFDQFISFSVIKKVLALYASPKLAEHACENLPVFCLLFSSFGALLPLNKKEDEVLRQGKDYSFLEAQQVRETLRSSRLGALVDKVDMQRAQGAFELFNKHVDAVRLSALFSQASRNSHYMDCANQAFESFCQHTGTSSTEKNLLELACCVSASPELQFLLSEAFRVKGLGGPIRRALFPELSDGQIRQVLTRDNWLLKSGILESQKTNSSLAAVSELWLDFFMSSESGNVIDHFFEAAKKSVASSQKARLDSNDKERFCSILKKSAKVKPVQGRLKHVPTHVLVYGKGNLDRIGLVFDAAQQSDVTLIKPNSLVDSSSAQGVIYAAFRAFAAQGDSRSAFLIPRASDVLTKDFSSAVREMFGIEVEPKDDGNLVDEDILSCAVPAVWVMSSTKNLHKRVLSLFNLHLKAEGASQAETRALLEDFVSKTHLSENTKIKVARIEGVSEAGLQKALETAARLHRAGSQSYESTVVDLLMKAQKAVGDYKTAQIELPTTYDLNNINAKGRFSPLVIAQALARNKKGTLCLFGLPGTGKTAFTRHLGQMIGVPVLEYKASQLLDKYVGGSETNIASMFEKATEQGALLLLDEGDTFLRSRMMADKSWEVSMVNELLQQMEAFQGIFVLATNLFRDIDEAALRRFVFKLEFQALSAEQRVKMFETESGMALSSLPESKAQQITEDLSLLRNLTPGDFAVVKRQSSLLGLNLSVDEFLEQLRIEVQFKNASLNRPASLQPQLDA